jgi:charged multivesicular body protein 1
MRVKELESISKKSAKQERVEKLRCKQAIQKNQMEKARVHAENAIRHKSQSLNFLRMSARVDAIVSRVQSAISTRKVRHICFHQFLFVSNAKR